MILAEAQSVLETGAVCDGCLGRCFADRSSDMTNTERGQGLRITLALVEDEPYDPVEPADCWVCEGVAPDYDEWAVWAQERLADLEFETMVVGTRVPSSLEENEASLREQADLDEVAGESLNAEMNRAVGTRLEQDLDVAVDFTDQDLVVILDIEQGAVELQLNPAYLYGRYRKHEASFPQQRRLCRECHGSVTTDAGDQCENCDGTGYVSNVSVERYITDPIQDQMDPSETIFNSAGREDDDLRMQGSGRPFVVEVKKPRRRPPDLEALQEAIAEASDGAVEVEGLTPADSDMVGHLSGADVVQTYRLTLSLEDAVDEAALDDAVAKLDGARVKQQVERDGRPTDMFRRIGGVTGELIAPDEVEIEVGSPGDVDLELLAHGGDGESDPNLAELLETEIEVTALAVVAVAGEDEPIEKEEYLGIG